MRGWDGAYTRLHPEKQKLEKKKRWDDKVLLVILQKNPAGEENPVGKETGGWGLGFELGCRPGGEEGLEVEGRGVGEGEQAGLGGKPPESAPWPGGTADQSCLDGAVHGEEQSLGGC